MQLSGGYNKASIVIDLTYNILIEKFVSSYVAIELHRQALPEILKVCLQHVTFTCMHSSFTSNHW